MTKHDFNILASEDACNVFGKDWMLVTAGTENELNMMTASWGGIGWLWDKPVAYVFIRPERHTHLFTEANERMTLSFYDESFRKALQLCGTKSGRDMDKVAATGLTPHKLESGAMTFAEARLTLDCRKLFKSPMLKSQFHDKTVYDRWYNDQPGGSLHDIYIVEIEAVYTK